MASDSAPSRGFSKDFASETTDLEIGIPDARQRIAWEDGIYDRPDRSGPSRNLTRRPSARSGSISSTRSRVQSIAAQELGIQIEYRTLSFGVSESRAKAAAAVDDKQHQHGVYKKAKKQDNTKDRDESKNHFAGSEYHSLSVNDLCQRLEISFEQGLTESAASTRRQRDGTNEIARTRENYVKKILLYVFGGFCSVLWVGVIIFFLCWQPLSSPPSIPNLALAILVIIVILLQASFSAFQDWSTARVMNSILDLLPAEATVRRQGQFMHCPAKDLVAGDIVQLSIGNKVPADMRLISTSGDVRFDRSILTGEAEEIDGAVDMTDPNFLESRNMAFMGTMVVNGGALGVVVLTGDRSVMGHIAQATSGVKPESTLIQKEISRFVIIITGLTACLASLILFTWVGWLRVDHARFMNVVAMLNDVMGCVVAFIPEGMPVAVALTLMMIARRMKVVHVLPKGLSTVETLGCVNVICSDKTGTLTENRMVVTTVAHLDARVENFDKDTGVQQEKPGRALQVFHQAAALCNDASFEPTTMHLELKEREIQGNATDGAVLRFAEKANSVAALREANRRVFEVPFNSKNKWMLTMHSLTGDLNDGNHDPETEFVIFVKGAPDVLLPRCTHYWSGLDDSVKPLDDHARGLFSTLQEGLSRNAERVILLCHRYYEPKSIFGSNDFSDEIKVSGTQGLIIIGVLGITDPPRAETKGTIAACRRAGARFFMVTGDFGTTAAAIARNVGIFSYSAVPDSFDQVMQSWQATSAATKDAGHDYHGLVERKSLLLDGTSIAKLPEGAWDTVCAYEEIVFARTSPEQKLKIVKEFRARDNIVAVTGDGVNDAPALRAANVGIAVVSGSDVAIEAADLILMDKFDSIIDAIRLGRLVFQNLQKVISYLLPAGSWSEIWPVLMNVFIGVPLPLSSFLMIIICVFTDLFLSLSLIMEKEEFDLLSLPPRNAKKDHLINLKIYAQSYLFTGVLETITAHSMFFLYMYRYAHIPFHALVFAFEKYSDGFYGYTQAQLTAFNASGQGVYFVTLVILQWGNVLSVRNKRLSIFQADPFTKQRRNPYLFGGMAISLAIAVFVTNEPGIQRLFGTGSVPLEFWFLPLPLAVGILVCDESRKLVVRTWPAGPVARIAW